MIEQNGLQHEELLMPAEVAEMFGVDPRTVTKWAREGKLPHARTPGGHRRYFKKDILPFLDGHEPQTLYSPGTVARMFGVRPNTVTRWAKSGRLTCVMTPGCHRRYLSTQIDPLRSQLRRD